MATGFDKLKQLIGMVGKDPYEGMSPEEKKLQKAMDYLRQINDGLTKEEFTKTVESVMKIIVQMEKRNQAAIAQLQQQHTSFMQEERGGHETTLADMKKQVDHVFVGEKLAEMRTMIEGIAKDAVEKMRSKMSEVDMKMMKVKDGYTPVKGKDYFDGKHGNIITPEEVYSKLRYIGVEMSVVKGLEEEIKSLRKEMATKASGGVRRVFQPYVDDFSASTNGSLKTFALSREPLRTNTIQVFGTDFPTILRPNTDFTVSGKTLTLTSAVPAPSAGATLLVHFFA